MMTWNREYTDRKKTLIDEMEKIYAGIVERGLLFFLGVLIEMSPDIWLLQSKS
jgi:hypothetical protein